MEMIASIFFFIILLYSAIIHEYSHGWMADQLGDATARLSGRLTMNPFAHIDPIGTILVPVMLFFTSGGKFVFGWAKPVPYNPLALKDPEKDAAKIAFAGPASNFIIALIFGLPIRMLQVGHLTEFLALIVYINILLAVFNLAPIPPLDGSKLLYALLPESASNFKVFLEKYGFLFLIFFIMVGFDLIVPIMMFLYRIITGQPTPF